MAKVCAKTKKYNLLKTQEEKTKDAGTRTNHRRTNHKRNMSAAACKAQKCDCFESELVWYSPNLLVRDLPIKQRVSDAGGITADRPGVCPTASLAPPYSC